MNASDVYLTLTPQQRLELLDEVSRQRGLAPAILEKDYWVCVTLGVLFGLEELGEHLVFKGGTSLSKVYGLIARFSEDIDLSFHRAFLGFGGEYDPEAAAGNEQKRRITALQDACKACISDRLLPPFQEALAERLGTDDGWDLEIDPLDPQTLLFHYPQAGSTEIGYIRPSVRIELGARSDHWPKEVHEIRSYMGESLDQPLGEARVQSLAAERTFWEKATLLHVECHRPTDKAVPPRYTRHYHDLALLAEASVCERALADTGLRQRVVEHKSIYFRSGWARYDLAVPGSFRLVPDEERWAELEKDHRAMLPMFFSPPPSMDEVLDALRALESNINAL